MSTRFPSPKDKWTDLEWGAWGREVASRFRWGSFTWDPPNCAANTTTDTTLTSATVTALDGLRTGMPVTVTPPSTLDAGLVVNAWVPADNELTIRLGNVTAGGINPAEATWAFTGNIL